MATGKQSNRQKLINVMYLTLLAMLALQVDIDVLNSFTRLKSQIRAAGVESKEKNVSFRAFMKEKIEKQVVNEGKHENEGLKDTLSQIEGETSAMISLLDDHIRELETIAKFNPENGEYEAKDETEKNYQYWLGKNEEANGQRGNGEGKELRDEMNDYYRFLNDIYNSQVMDSLEEAPHLLEDPPKGFAKTRKSWEQSTFEGPVIANITSLEAFKLEVYRREKEVLDVLNVRLGAPQPFQPDTIVPITAPVARVVPAGMPFETRILIGMLSKNLKPEFNSPNGNIRLEENGNMGMLSITADGRNIPEGKTEGVQSYTASVKVPKATGGFETLTLRDNFIVRKPEVVVTSAAVQLLYRNCGNQLNITAPALGDYYFPQVSAQGGQIRKKNNTRSIFTVIPNGNKCLLDVKSTYGGNTVQLDKIAYKVIAPPKPEVRFKVNGTTFNGYQTVPKNSRFSFWLNPDKDFKAQLPRDARYEVSSIDIKLARGLSVPTTVKTIRMSGKDATRPSRISMPSQVRQAPAGSRVYIVINKVYRINFEGKREEVPLSELVKTVGFSLR